MLKQALVVAMNYEGDSNALPGSLNTGDAWYLRLTQAGFLVNYLREAAARRASIAAAIRSMYAAARGIQGAPIVIVYNGHGVQLNYQGQVIDALVPYDALLPSVNWNLTVPYYQWNAIIAERPPHCRLWTCMDLCFGGAFQSTPARRYQYVPGPQLVDNPPPFFGFDGDNPLPPVWSDFP